MLPNKAVGDGEPGGRLALLKFFILKSFYRGFFNLIAARTKLQVKNVQTIMKAISTQMNSMFSNSLKP